MINPLKVATSGYLKRTTKAVLIIAVSGYLNFGGAPPPPPTPSSGGGGGGGHHRKYEDDQEKRNKEQREQNEKILVEILKFWSKEMQV